MKKLMVFLLSSIFLFLFIDYALAESINLTYPKNVNVGIEFNISLVLNNFSGEVYDIKIDILNNTNSSQRLSEIFNGSEWKSTNYYLNNIINISIKNNEIFRLNITKNYHGIAKMDVKIRKSGETTAFKSGNCTINISFETNNNLVGCIVGDFPEQNLPQNQNQQDNSTTQEEVYLKLDWDEDEIINGKKFEIEVRALNLKNENYDIKIYIKPEDEETVLSEVYYEKEDKWLSGNYYVKEIISGSGEKEETFSLRIKNKYNNFSGDAEIVAKIRKSGASFVIDETREDVEVLKKEEETHAQNNIKSSEIKNNKIAEENTAGASPITGEVIQLGNRQAKEEVLYESRSEKIKKYSVYGLNLVLAIIIGFLIMNKKVLKPEKQE